MLRRKIAWLLVTVMLLSLVNPCVVSTYAQECETIVEDIATEEIADENVTMTEEIAKEVPTEVDITTEQKTEALVEETTTEVVTEVITTDSTLSEESSEEGSTPEQIVLSSEIPESVEPIIVSLESKLETQKASKKYTIYSDGTWEDGVIWYVNPDKKHYVFCLEKGKTMYTGKYTGDITKGYSGYEAYRISAALDYFEKINGGWGGKTDYGMVQQVVWNEGNSDLKKYINQAWKLVNINENRSSSSASYDNRLFAIKNEENVTSDEGRAMIANQTQKQTVRDSDNDGVIQANYGLQGSAWKYMAAGPMNSSGITVVGSFDKDGNPINNPYAEDNYVDKAGMLHVKYPLDVQTQLGYKENPVTVIMQVDLPYQGEDSFQYLKTDGDKQNLTYDASGSSHAYFSFALYTSNAPRGITPILNINKIDEFGYPVYGCTFELSGYSINGPDDVEMFTPVQKVINSNEDYFAIEKPGNYTIKEIDVPSLEWTVSISELSFKAVWVTENNEQKLQITEPLVFPSGVNSFSQNADGSWTYTTTNYYNPGGALLVKYGNVLTGYSNGEFTYEKRRLPGAEFDFYTAEEIYYGDKLVFDADTKLENGMEWGIDTGVEWTHTVEISSMHTDSQGEISLNDLPAGLYYAVESVTPDEFTADNKKHALYK